MSERRFTPRHEPGMKAGELEKCCLCGKGMMHSGVPLFYRVTVEHMGVKVREVQRAHGMEEFMGGNVALARVFHDPDIAERIGEPTQKLVCQTCALEPHLLAQIGDES